MASYQVIAVDTERSWNGSHDHISKLKVRAEGGYGEACTTRSAVAFNLRSPYGDRYFTMVNNRRAAVIVVECPGGCGMTEYIRTEADATTTNNLLSLPKAYC